MAEEQNFAFSLQHYVVDYDVIDRRLEVNRSEAKKVLEIFRRYLELGSVRAS